MAVRRLKEDVVLDHPVRTFLRGLVGTVNGAEKALADFDVLARRSMDMEALLLRQRELATEADLLLGAQAPRRG